MQVVPLHDGRPSLRDIPGRLRSLAEMIEKGELGDVRFVVCAIVRRDHSQQEHGYGDLTVHEAVGAFSWGAAHIGEGEIG